MEKHNENSAKTKTSTQFNYLEHNRKVAKLRGRAWKEKLRLAKIRKESHVRPLLAARMELGLSQRDMIPLLGVNNNTIYSRIERGDRPAQRGRAEKIAKILKKPLDELFIEYDKDKFIAI